MKAIAMAAKTTKPIKTKITAKVRYLTKRSSLSVTGSANRPKQNLSKKANRPVEATQYSYQYY